MKNGDNLTDHPGGNSMSKDDLRFLEALRAHREGGYGMGRPIAARPGPLFWIIQGWGGYALALILFAALILLGGW